MSGEQDEGVLKDRAREETSNLKWSRWWINFLVIMVGAFTTRLYDLSNPALVSWDEAHFGKFVNFYMNRTYFFDVHPPGGKMLLALVGMVTGYDGSFNFDNPGDEYGDAKYCGMRKFCATLGALTVLLIYCHVYHLTKCEDSALFSSSLVLFDHSMLVITRFILLDSILLFFTALATFLHSLSHECEKRNKCTWTETCLLVATGMCLGVLLSVKFCALFTYAYLGVATLVYLCSQLSDLSVSSVDVFKSFSLRVVNLVVIPAAVYTWLFHLHFVILRHSGPNDQMLSLQFQTTLLGSVARNAYVSTNLAHGSLVTIRGWAAGGAYLHSHHHAYPPEHPPRQQQVTGYIYDDANSQWLVRKPNATDVTKPYNQPLYVKDGDLVVLQHHGTGRNLHSHVEKAPVAKGAFQVSCYGENGVGDDQDLWRVVILSGAAGNSRVAPFRTRFKLVHFITGCELMESGETLPPWGFNQNEVICSPSRDHSLSSWFVAFHHHPHVPKKKAYKLVNPSFMSKFAESHAVMFKVNNMLIPRKYEVTSKPWHWVVSYKGLQLSAGHNRIYLLGNPVIFWSVLLLYPAYAGILVAFVLSRLRRIRLSSEVDKLIARAAHASSVCVLGWVLHYLPYFFMSRVLYFHHYFPAFLFYAMTGGIVIAALVKLMVRLVCYEGTAVSIFSNVYSAAVVLVWAYSFNMFKFLAYGMSGPRSWEENSSYAAYRWLDSWDF